MKDTTAAAILDELTLTAALDALGISYSTDCSSDGGVDIFIHEQVVEQS